MERERRTARDRHGHRGVVGAVLGRDEHVPPWVVTQERCVDAGHDRLTVRRIDRGDEHAVVRDRLHLRLVVPDCDEDPLTQVAALPVAGRTGRGGVRRRFIAGKHQRHESDPLRRQSGDEREERLTHSKIRPRRAEVRLLVGTPAEDGAHQLTARILAHPDARHHEFGGDEVLVGALHRRAHGCGPGRHDHRDRRRRTFRHRSSRVSTDRRRRTSMHEPPG